MGEIVNILWDQLTQVHLEKRPLKWRELPWQMFVVSGYFWLFVCFDHVIC